MTAAPLQDTTPPAQPPPATAISSNAGAPPLCLGRLWGVNWPGEGTVFDRLTVVKGEYTDVVIERALRVCKRRP